MKIISTSTLVHGMSDLSPPPIFEGDNGTARGVPGASGIRVIWFFDGESGARGGLVDGGLVLGGAFSASDDCGDGDGVVSLCPCGILLR